MITSLDFIQAALLRGLVVPYLGPGVLGLAGPECPLPATAETLVTHLTATAKVPHKLMKNLTGAAQFLENFKHRKTVVAGMTKAFQPEFPPTELHGLIAELAPPLVVHAWYDRLPQRALAAAGSDWGILQGVSQAEHQGAWAHAFRSDGTRVDPAAQATEIPAWKTLLYQPLGSISPAANFLVSDSDFVEVLTEIDIQTPMPERVQALRTGRNFLFLGCRFNTQMDRIFAHQISKRSSTRHWAILPEEPTRNEIKFMEEHRIERLAMPLAEAVRTLAALPRPATPRTPGVVPNGACMPMAAVHQGQAKVS